MTQERQNASFLYLIIALTCTITMLVWTRFPDWQDMLIYDSQKCEQGQWYRLVTCGFLHAHGNHLLGNMLFLLIAGRSLFIRWQMSDKKFFLLYIPGIAASIYFDHLFRTHETRALGASGGVAAVLAVSVLLSPWRRYPIRSFLMVPGWVFLLINIAREIRMVGYQDNVAHLAHLGGYLYGVVFVCVFYRDVLKANIEKFKEKVVEV